MLRLTHFMIDNKDNMYECERKEIRDALKESPHLVCQALFFSFANKLRYVICVLWKLLDAIMV